MDKNTEQEMLKELSPQLLCSGLQGIFADDKYESVEVKVKFSKKKPNKINVDAMPKEFKKVKDIGELILTLGDSFRGLWKNKEIDMETCEIPKEDGWTVTLIYKGHYVETPYYHKPEAALESAIMLKNMETNNG